MKRMGHVTGAAAPRPQPGGGPPRPARLRLTGGAPLPFLFLLLFLALPGGTAFAEWALPVSTTAEGGGKGISGSYEASFAIGQASPVGRSSASGYSLAAGLMAMLSDRQGPAIDHQPVAVVAARTAVTIEADVSDAGTGVDTVIVYFREGGAATFREKPMVRSEGSTYTADLPPSAVTERGLAYYIEARDHLGNRGRRPQGAPDSLSNIAVYSADLASAFELPAGKYRMISLPGMPTDGGADSVLADDLGAYAKADWRLGRWNGARSDCGERCYDEYPTIDDFAPGRAFWAISSAAHSFDMSGTTADISRPFEVRLARGWNQVGTPFGFPTDWLSTRIVFAEQAYAVGNIHVVGADTIFVEDNLIAYDGAYLPFQSQLLPWAGYWIYNSSTAEVDLRFDPNPARQALLESGPAGTQPGARPADGVRSPALAPSGAAGGTLDFAIGVSVKCADGPEGQEDQGLAGISTGARDTWDAFDLHEPPAIDAYLRVVFRHEDWGRRSGVYMTDVRGRSNRGARWEFTVETSGRRHPALDLAAAGDIPETWEVYIYDLEAGLRLDRATLPYSFDVEGKRTFALVTGTADFVASEEASADISLRAGIVSVVPNPFTANVRIAYFLAESEPAALKVFSVEGRLVDELPCAASGRGIHTVTWDGRSLQDEPAAPGIYFLRLETARGGQVRKMLKIR